MEYVYNGTYPCFCPLLLLTPYSLQVVAYWNYKLRTIESDLPDPSLLVTDVRVKS